MGRVGARARERRMGHPGPAHGPRRPTRGAVGLGLGVGVVVGDGPRARQVSRGWVAQANAEGAEKVWALLRP